MGLKIKHFNILGIHRKEGITKNQHVGGDYLKRVGLDSLQILAGAWRKRGAGVFESGGRGGLIPNAHNAHPDKLICVCYCSIWKYLKLTEVSLENKKDLF